jgi:dTDP-4-dehydrorhamnose 3,5-epimerase
MHFIPTPLQGAYIIKLQQLEDERGFFARTWCQREFLNHGLDPSLVQCNVSFNHKKGTIRGMHFQLPPHAETKLVRCIKGKIYDVIVDLRPDSETYLQWTAVDLTAENRRALYIPKGFAHGFQALENNTEVFYQMSDFYSPSHACGFRWNDPSFRIDWPEIVSVISERDQTYPDFTTKDFVSADFSQANG